MLAGYANDFWSLRQLSLGDQFHVTLLSDNWGQNVYIYNDAQDGPYRGGIVSVTGGTEIKTTRALGRTAGIYYRYFQWFDGSTLWTLMVSLWWPAGIFGGAFVATGFREYRRRSAIAAHTIDRSPPKDES